MPRHGRAAVMPWHCVFLVRGFTFTHEAVREWAERFAPLIAVKLKAKRKAKYHSRRWYCDETYVKVNKKWCSLDRAIDSHGFLTDVRLSETRDLAAAEAFFRQALATIGKSPKTVTTDKHGSYPTAIKQELGKNGEHLCRTTGARHRTDKYVNNVMEQDHRWVKQRYYPMRTFKDFESASRFCSVFDEQRDYFRRRRFRNEELLAYQKRGTFKSAVCTIAR